MTKYIITEERLKELLEAEASLLALECGGVDNWDWYSDSLEDHYEEPTITKEFEVYAGVAQ